MALIKCSECGNTISDKAKVCPRCGNPIGTADPAQQTTQQATEGSPKKVNYIKAVLYSIIGLLAIAIITLGIFIYSDRSHGKPIHELDDDISDTSETEEAVDEGTNFSVTPVDTYSPNDTPSDFFCHSQDLDSNDDSTPEEGAVIDGKSAQIQKAWLEHDVNSCIKIHVKMSTTNLRGEQLNVMCLFWFDDGRQINSTDGRYETAERQVCTRAIVTPNNQKCNLNDLTLSIPYTQIKRVRDWKHLKCRVEVFYENQRLAASNYMHFACWLD